MLKIVVAIILGGGCVQLSAARLHSRAAKSCDPSSVNCEEHVKPHARRIAEGPLKGRRRQLRTGNVTSTANRVPCKSTRPGDFPYRACQPFCKPGPGASCAFCKCQSCTFCGGTTTVPVPQVAPTVEPHELQPDQPQEPPPRAGGDLFGWRALCTPLPALVEQALPPSERGFQCNHKPLFSPRLAPLDITTMLLVFCVAALALASGIGGGGIYVPALNLMLRFKPHVATGLSQCLICGGAIGALFVNARERHPLTPKRPLIDLGLAAFLSPAEMAGAQIGVVLNQALPSPVILAAMAMVLSVLAVRTLRKGLAAYAKEREAYRSRVSGSGDDEEGRLLAPPSAAAPRTREIMPPTPSGPPSPPPSPPSATPSVEDTLLAPIAWLLTGRSSSTSSSSSSSRRAATDGNNPLLVEIFLLFIVWLGLLLVLLARGRKGTPSIFGIRPCSTGYWLISLFGLAWLLLVGIVGGRRLVRLSIAKQQLQLEQSSSSSAPSQPQALSDSAASESESSQHGGSMKVEVERIPATPATMQFSATSGMTPALTTTTTTTTSTSSLFLSGDVRWDGARGAYCLLQAILAGIVAGLVGVGGGMVLGPMMIELGVLPQVSSATTGTMVLLTSSSAAAVFLLSGLIPIDYAIAFGLVAMAGGFVGKICITALVRKYRASALIVLLLGGLIATSMLATTAAGLLDLRSKAMAGRLNTVLALRMPCSA